MWILLACGDGVGLLLPSLRARKSLLQEYESSGMNMKDYARAHGIARSTLYSWSAGLGIPYSRGNKKALLVKKSRVIPSTSDPFSKGKHKGYKKDDVIHPPPTSDFSFIDITAQIAKDPVSFSQQDAQSLEPCGLEVQSPMGSGLNLRRSFLIVYGVNLLN
jgi:hypothetical protein